MLTFCLCVMLGFMEISKDQYELIADCFAPSRGVVKLSNLDVLNAWLYLVEQGCKWRALPERFGKWQTVYKRVRRWSDNGVLAEVFTQMQQRGIMDIEAAAAYDDGEAGSDGETGSSANAAGFMLDSTIIKVHPDAAGALGKRGLRA